MHSPEVYSEPSQKFNIALVNCRLFEIFLIRDAYWRPRLLIEEGR